MAEPNMKENTLLALHPTLKYVAVVFYWDKFNFYGLLLPMTSMHPPRQMLMRKTQRPVSAFLFNIKIVLTIYTAFSAYLLTAQIGVIYLENAALRSAKMSIRKYITLDNKHHISEIDNK